MNAFMSTIIQRINTIISELENPEVRLKNTLLKVQVLAHKLKSLKIQQWVNSELSGYEHGAVVPNYRILATPVLGNFIQNLGYRGTFLRKNQVVSIEYLDKDYYDQLKEFPVGNSVAELEVTLEKENNMIVYVPDITLSKISKLVEPSGWYADKAWQEISSHRIEGLLHSIKASLLNFMLELADEIGEQSNLEMSGNAQYIDQILKKIMENSQGGSFNFISGNNNNQGITTGENTTMNMAQGESINQTVGDSKHYEELDKLGVQKESVSELKTIVESNKTNQPALMQKVMKWLGTVSASLAARGLYENLPAVTDIAHKFISGQ